MTLKVIGAGFGRTGTLSLKLALEELGFGPCYHMTEVMEHEGFPSYWAHLARGGTVDWDEVFQGYDATVDWPACTYYRELAERYPEAKVILTVRDPDEWYESTQKTIFRPEFREMLLAEEMDPDIRDMMHRVVTETFDGRITDRDYATRVFNAHIAEVKRTIARDRLLVFEVAEGWEPLCRFLGKPVPDGPFPRSNTEEDFLNMVESREEEFGPGGHFT